MSNTTTAITPEQFIAEVRKVAAERPNYVYENPEWINGSRGFCKYMHGDEPGCIIGTAAYGLGVVLFEEGGVLEVLKYDVPDLYKGLAGFQADWLLLVQTKQDDGFTWGEAVDEADRKYPGV